MSLLKPFAVSALLGTRKQAPTRLSIEGPIGSLLDAMSAAATSEEAKLLRAAGVLDICQQTGWLAPHTSQTMSAAAPEESLALPPAEATPLLVQIFAEGNERLAYLTLFKLAQHRLRLPPGMLADRLENARRDGVLRNLLAPVLGERGRWLAERNPAWQVQAIDHSAPPDEETWNFGSLDQRLVYLQALRERDSAAARERLAAVLKELDARERAALTRVLASNLSADDEPLLEALRADRSKEVRRAAVDLLVLLPSSAYTRRMAERLASCVSFASGEPDAGGLKGLFKRVTKAISSEPLLRIEPPETFFADGKDDQLEEAVPASEGLGQRAWWLYQVVAASPLHWWRQHGALSPTELLAAAGESDWNEAMLRGWYEATLREADALWAAALIGRLSPGGAHLGRVFLDSQPLLALLPLNERERYWLQAAASPQGHNGVSLSRLLDQILAAVPVESQLGADFCRQLLPHLRHALGQQRTAHDYGLRNAMRAFATLLPAETFDAARQGWPENDTLSRHQSEAIDDWRHTLTLRENLQQLLD